MFEAAKYCRSHIGLLVAVLLLSPNALRAQDRHSGDIALLAISLEKERPAAGMMCVGAEVDGMDRTANFPNCDRLEVSEREMCRGTSLSILNPNVLAFDVTLWPRQAIAVLANRVRIMTDPLNRDFSKARVTGLKVRRIEETDDREILSPPTFELNSGCYLLMIVPDPISAPGS